VQRTIHPQVPPKVEYQLTNLVVCLKQIVDYSALPELG
jgi:DNA-binding HxlR family transcriptional regulator